MQVDTRNLMLRLYAICDGAGYVRSSKTRRGFLATLWQHLFRISDTSGVMCGKLGNLLKTVGNKRKKPPFLAASYSWRCGESNPGPITEPSVFYVRSLLAMRRFFCPHRCRRQLMASISTVKVPCRPCGSTDKASLLNDAQHPPKDEKE